MPTTSQVEVNKLSLDLKNFRTVPQKKEADAIKAMISIKPDRFYAVMESIIDDGYLPTENIIVLKDGEEKLIVKEGNRRIAALKLISGKYKLTDYTLPRSITDKIAKLDGAWAKNNQRVPCTIFAASEAATVDRVVTLAHGKGEKASRDPWNSVARARHNRDVKGVSEPALDLLEKYLKNGNNVNNAQKDRWSGEYPLTVLEEAMRKIYPRLGLANALELSQKYPKINQINDLEEIILHIGTEIIKFETIRASDFPTNYGILPLQTSTSQGGNSSSSGSTTSTTSNPNTSNSSTSQSNSGQAPSSQTGNGRQTQGTPQSSSGNQASTSSGTATAYASNDPKNVASILKKFNPKGNNRQKVVTLLEEVKKLKIKDNPIAFCFLLRSMFEISAKAYCADHVISTVKKDGRDKPLVDILREVTNHLTNNQKNTAMVKVLHGAMTEIGRNDGILSVTSMNQLVHNPSFSVSPPDICTLFGNIYPLLESMN